MASRERIDLSLSGVKLIDTSARLLDPDAKPGKVKVDFSFRFESDDDGVDRDHPGVINTTVRLEGRGGNTEEDARDGENSFEVKATFAATFKPKGAAKVSAEVFSELYDELVPLVFPYVRLYLHTLMNQMGVMLSLPFSPPPKSDTKCEETEN
jgi:hypothetical protein